MVRLVTNDHVREFLDMAATIEVVERAYRADAAGRAVSIPRSDMILPVSGSEAYVFKVMPGAVEDLGVAALRVQSDLIRWGDGRKEKLGVARDGQYTEYVQVYDTDTTEPVLVMPDGYASKMRVGATNGIAAKHMAPPDARTVGLLGAGRQAGGQAWGFDEALDLEEIRVYSPTRENREAFARAWSERLDAEVVVADCAREAVRGADVLACGSNAMEPIFDPGWIEPGTHVSAIKNPEVPDEAFGRVDRVCINTHLTRYGPDNYAPRGSDFGANLDDAWAIEGFDLASVPDLPTEIASERDRDPAETTFFLNNQGVGIQWAAVGKHVLECAVEADVGVEVDADHFLQAIW